VIDDGPSGVFVVEAESGVLARDVDIEKDGVTFRTPTNHKLKNQFKLQKGFEKK
jgi:hypothetical protein